MATSIFNPVKFRNRYRLVKNYLQRKTVLDSMPVEVIAETTNYCNATCVHCPQMHATRGFGYIEMDTFKKIVDQSKDFVELFYLHLGGEPLMHPKLFEIIEYAKKNDVCVGLSSNGALLNEKMAKGLLDAGLDYLIVSIDAFSAKVYEEVKGRSDFSNVNKHVEQFLELRKEYKNPPFTALQIVEMDCNRADIPGFVSYWRKAGVDTVRVKPFLNWGGQVAELSKDRKLTGTRQGKPPCVLLWRQMTFAWNGDLVFCCFDIVEGKPLGNIHKASLRELWNAQGMVELRDFHAKGRQDLVRLCSTCNAPEMNPGFMLGQIFADGFTAKRTLVRYERLKRVFSPAFTSY
jgi:pyruvate-formate lyase-activating enzyme